MTPALIAALTGLALLDSLNPSAIVATILLMTQPRFGVRVVTYVGAVFVTYFLAGVAILAGLDVAWAYLDNRVGYALQAILGAGLLGYAVFAPTPKADAPQRPIGAGLGLPAIALLGAGVTLAEFSTALPYVGALALLADAPISWAVRGAVLVAYNLVFVAPPLLLAAAYLGLGERVRPRLERWGGKLSAGARTTMLWLMGIAGFLLLRNGLILLGVDLGFVNIPALAGRD